MIHPHYDVAIFDAGIVGLAHALAAGRRGLRTIVFERNEKESPVQTGARRHGRERP